MQHPVITLTTDFGLKDPYVAEMKAIILSINPNAIMVDISHEVAKFNIRMGAYLLACAAPYFPQGSVHVAVVDPTVGTKRKLILVHTKNAYYLGPDNGILSLAIKNQTIEGIHEITNQKLTLPTRSNTFHGRDVLAPAAAHLTNGTHPSEFGPKINKIATTTFSQITHNKGTLTGEVIHTDDFGNIVTNFGPEELKLMKTKHTIHIKLKNKKLQLKLCKTYAEVPKQKPLALIGSHNFLEISINQGNAAKTLKTKTGDKTTLYQPQEHTYP